LCLVSPAFEQLAKHLWTIGTAGANCVQKHADNVVCFVNSPIILPLKENSHSGQATLPFSKTRCKAVIEDADRLER
jgi:hypothetical protein